MQGVVLGLDIGGANLKAATAQGPAVSVPFPLWKRKDDLPAALADLIGRFPEASSLAVTMTGELCDCFETKREGVNFILDSLPAGMPARVWTTLGGFLSVGEAKELPFKVAAANWHAAASYAGRNAPVGDALFLDVGSTTTDIIPLDHGVPSTFADTDNGRLRTSELVYTGVRRTPVCAVMPERTCAEFFADMRDVNILLGLMPEAPDDTDTADGRPASRNHSLARIARMFGGDVDSLSETFVLHEATRIHARQVGMIAKAIRNVVLNQPRPLEVRTAVFAGSGEWLARKAFRLSYPDLGASEVSITAELGPERSAAFPAYALAVLGTEET